jgi:uncharacterized metal-binding protein YceD (DUF177 family)
VTVPEFSRSFALNTIGTTARVVSVIANPDECAALAKRFDLAALDGLGAKATLVTEGEAVLCVGTLNANVVQHCVATAAPVVAKLKSDFVIRFVAHMTDAAPADEIEINVDDCDIVEHDGASIDLGEAVAQTLLLALDPFPRARDAEGTLKAAGVIGEDEVVSGAFAGLKSLLGKD